MRRYDSVIADRAPGWQPIHLDPPLPVDAVPTPALMLDADALERNLARMQQHLRQAGLGARPHTKTHKCPILAERQMEHGAVGVCCAKVSEAEVMARAGLEEILITSPLVTRDAIRRAVDLARRLPGVQIVVDHPAPARELAEAATTADVEVAVLIDLDVGTHRTGIAPGEPALALHREIAACRGLRFAGLQAYAGHLMHVQGFEHRAGASRSALAAAVATRDAIESSGCRVPILTGGGTGTFDIDVEVEGMTDLQVGSYVFMDVQYRAIGSRAGATFDHFETSLFVLVTAISQPMEGRITVDGGFKAFATDDLEPQPRDLSGVHYHWGGDEHGILQLQDPSRPIRRGTRLAMSIPHCDPTVNLYDFFHLVRGDQVEELWPIAARGCSQ